MTAHARSTDPQTSHEAAKSVTDAAMTETHRAIMRLLESRPMNDEQLYQMFVQGAEHDYWNHASMSGVRSRRSELVKRGLVKDCGRSKTKFGRASIIWGRA